MYNFQTVFASISKPHNFIYLTIEKIVYIDKRQKIPKLTLVDKM